jgi:hypothetical protein
VARFLKAKLRRYISSLRGRGREGRTEKEEEVTYLSNEEPGKQMRREVEEAHHVHVLCHLNKGCENIRMSTLFPICSLSLFFHPLLPPSLPPSLLTCPSNIRLQI